MIATSKCDTQCYDKRVWLSQSKRRLISSLNISDYLLNIWLPCSRLRVRHWKGKSMPFTGCLIFMLEVVFSLNTPQSKKSVTFFFKKMHLKISSGIWRPFCLGLNVLNVNEYLLQHAYKEFIERHCSYWAHNVILIHQEADPSHECFKIRLSMLYPEIHLWLNYKLNRQLAQGIDIWLHPIIFYTSKFNVPRCRARRFMTTQKNWRKCLFL